MNHNRILILAAATLSATLWAYACGDGTTDPPAPPPDPPRPTTVTVSPATAELTALGATAQLSAEVRDQNGQVMAGAAVVWASDNAPVATVGGSGLVTAAGNGTATITATAGSVSGSATVTVAQRVSAVTVSPAADTLVAGDTLRMAAEATDANGHVVAGGEFSWASSDTSVAVVDDAGLVTGVGAGHAEVRATASGVTGRADLTVVAPAPTTITVTPDTVALAALGQTAQLSAEVRDQAGRAMAGAPVAWSSADTTVAAVDSAGVVTAAGVGETTITATSGEASGEAVVTVMQPADSVVVSPAADTVAPGDTLRLEAEAFDANGHRVEDAEFDWSSSAVSVAQVNESGLVMAVAEGTATITATTANVRGTAEITVQNPDRAALLALYNATDGPHWVDNKNWLTDAPLGEWYGVDTDVSGRVVRLDLGGRWDEDSRQWIRHGLTGPIPPQLGNLANLTRLELGHNDLSGPIPPELGGLASLTRLSLRDNDLSGPIPPELGDLANLESLSADFNSLSGPIPPELGGLAQLHGLWLYTNRLSGPIPPELGDLADLAVLNLGDNDLSGPIPPELGDLAKLEALAIYINRLSGPIPPELGDLANLAVLNLGGNDLSGPVPPELGDLANLTRLILIGNSALAGVLPETLTALTSLESLWFADTGLCAPATTEFHLWLEGVQSVRGENCPIGQGDREALAAFYNWTNGAGWINKDNWLDDGSLDEWHGVTSDSTDRVTALVLPDNNLSGILPVEVGNLLHLEELDVSGNDALAGQLPFRMVHLVSLSKLRLDDTGLCAGRARVFEDWLARIAERRLALCPDDHGNEADGATEVSLGEEAGGELESHADEDWFQIEIGRHGTLTLATKGNTNLIAELISAEGELLGYHIATPIFMVRNVTAGTYYVRLRGYDDETRGAYSFLSAFEPRTRAVPVRLTQATQSHDFSVPLVAGEDALLRVFVMADSGVVASMPPVQATLYRGGEETHSVRIDGSSIQVPWTMVEGNLDATANAVIPGAVLVPGTEVVVEVDPDGMLDPSLGIGGRIPARGRVALDVRAVPDFHVTAVPLLWAANPDSSGYKVAVELTAEHELFNETRDWLPVDEFEVAVREAVLVDYDPGEGDGLARTLSDVALVRAADGADGYYMGVIPRREGGVRGRAYLPGMVSVSLMDGRVIAHEFGHNFSLAHAPCGNPAGVDGRYPHAGGLIGSWGYDFRRRTLVDPEIHTDLMTYCDVRPWISDYSFARALEHRAGASAAAGPQRTGPVLVVRGGVARGQLTIEPAFVLDAPPALPETRGGYRMVGSDADGRELFGLSFSMQRVADAEDESAAGFTFAIPAQAAWADALAAISLTGPEGSVELPADDSTRPATMLVLDQETRRIRAILRESPEQPSIAGLVPYLPPSVVGQAAAGAGVARGAGIEVLFSRGIPGKEAWRR